MMTVRLAHRHRPQTRLRCALLHAFNADRSRGGSTASHRRRLSCSLDPAAARPGGLAAARSWLFGSAAVGGSCQRTAAVAVAVAAQRRETREKHTGRAHTCVRSAAYSSLLHMWRLLAVATTGLLELRERHLDTQRPRFCPRSRPAHQHHHSAAWLSAHRQAHSCKHAAQFGWRARGTQNAGRHAGRTQASGMHWAVMVRASKGGHSLWPACGPNRLRHRAAVTFGFHALRCRGLD